MNLIDANGIEQCGVICGGIRLSVSWKNLEMESSCKLCDATAFHSTLDYPEPIDFRNYAIIVLRPFTRPHECDAAKITNRKPISAFFSLCHELSTIS